MKTEKLFELLTLVGGITSRKWDTVLQLIELIQQGSVTIKEGNWRNWKKQFPDLYSLDLSKIDTWSTYDNTCIELHFSNDTTKENGHPNNQLVCKVKIYEGDNFHGERKELRFEALLWLPTAFIHNIEQRIEWAYDNYLEDAYEKHLEKQKAIWINNMRNNFLKK